ncbi:DNA polymerase III subunit delta [Fuchsiella alkaliacetigena]|uniref:DNA polymerase III subunit delta n=1 Tax=Fuchsiella alkaliacetigena TaxID=957042 RepID=UPI00200B0483|nr:DNA polymerase III subunit delta [Fuchsiella alkaliacetigena]MCK8825207.1 DNA polymerase III subunit delta [Fuchsiella alkaliacetigena]
MKVEDILTKELKELNNIYLLFGEEKLLINEFIDKFIDKFVAEQSKDFNLSFINDNNKEEFISQLINSVNQLPFNAEKRIIIVESSRAFSQQFRKEEKEKLEYLLADFPDTSIMLFKTQRSPDKRTKLYKLFKEKGEILEFTSLRSIKLNKWIKKRVAAADKKIDGQAIEFLKESFENDLQRLDMELNKLLTFIGQDDLITLAKAKAIISQDRLLAENIIFDFVDAIGTQNSSQALKLLNDMLAEGQSEIGLLMMITRQVRLMLQVKSLNRQGYSLKKMASRLQEHPYPVEKCLKQSRNFSTLELKKAMQLLFKTNLNLVTGGNKKLELELLIMQLKQLSS